MFSLLIKPTGLHNLFLGEENVGLVFTEDFVKEVMLLNSEIFAIGTGWSHDFQPLFFLFTQMQKEGFIDSLLSFLMVDLRDYATLRRENNTLQIWHQNYLAPLPLLKDIHSNYWI